MSIHRLRTRLSLSFAIFAFLAIAVLSLIIGQRAVKQVETEIGSALGETAHLMADKLDHFMWSRYGETQLLATLPELQQPDNPEAISRLVNQLNETFPSFSWIGFTDPDGTVLASTDDILKGVDISERPVYMEALEKPFIGDVHEAVLLADLLPNPTGEEMKFVDISTPVFNGEDKLVGVLATHLSWTWLKEVKTSMAETLKGRKGVEFFIVSPAASDIVLGPEGMLGKTLETDSLQLASEGNSGWTREVWPDGKEYLTGFMQERGYEEYPGLGWSILVRQPVEEAYAPARELMMYFVVTGILLVVAAAVAGMILAGWMTRPLNRITRVADRLRGGENVEIPPYRGITEIEILSDSLRTLVADLTSAENRAQHDELTRLPNRYALDAYFEEREQDAETLAVLYLDLDGFKAVNDTYGHAAGDQLLRQVADRVRSVAGIRDLAVRIGGDEFVVVLRDPQDAGKMGRLTGEKLIRLLNEPFRLDGATVSIGCSIGLSVWTAGDSISSTLREADERLYKAKRAGKNRLVSE